MSAAGPYRLPSGGRVDRSRSVAFRFDGRLCHGHPGDTLASALLADGVRVVARSFKFRRPRGIFSCGIEEPNALVQLGQGPRAVPSSRAPVVELQAGLEARSQKGWPSVDFDFGRILDATAALWSAGFYNKTFISPEWSSYEGLIRRLAGLGRTPPGRDPDRYEVSNHHCDVLVVGGGRAGLSAALDAARAGARVVLAEQDRELGGALAWNGSDGELAARNWIGTTLAELAGAAHVRLLTRTAPVGCYDHNVVALAERCEPGAGSLARERLHVVRARRLVLATGTIEQPLVFSNNDRPGIVLAAAARQYLRRYGVAVGHRILIATNNDSAYALAIELAAAGVPVPALIDSRPEREVPEGLRRALRDLGIELFPHSLPVDTAGFGALRSVTVGRLAEGQHSVQALRAFRCDALAVSGGFSPALQLYAQAGGALRYDERSGALQPAVQLASVEIVGAAARPLAVGLRVSPVGNTRRQWVDLAHDVTVADLALSLRENYTAIEHVKRYTTVGMAADQGKTSHAAALDIVGKLRGVPARELGHTTLRPPVTPVTLGTLAGCETGERFAPRRRLPVHDWHAAHGAILQDFGGWQRPVAYPEAGESREHAVAREALAVRTAAGLLDGSSLGKIEVEGPDALEFLDRFYINNLRTLQPGRVRYGLMLRETGTLLDDGTVAALAPDHLLLTTTSGNAGRVYQWLEEWHQCEWPELKVALTSVTEQWATLSLAGPEARTILAQLETDIDLSNAAFPHLAMRAGNLAGFPVRICRVSFTGERTYEINVAADSAPALWEALIAAGAPHGLQPLGLDALMLLRLEKGFLHLGADTDGTTVPDDVGWGKVASGKTRDYVGKRSLALPEHLRPDRLQLVGVVPASPAPERSAARRTAAGGALIVGSHLRLPDSRHATDGWITSAGIATLTGEPIALAMLRAGRQRIGAEVSVYDGGAPVARGRIVNPPFYDPSGERMNG
jgi:sarcosine oxidase, subunit alpha